MSKKPGHGWSVTSNTNKTGAGIKEVGHFGIRKNAINGGLQKLLGESGGKVITEENGHRLGEHTYKKEDPKLKDEDHK